ncbi:MAG: hypothetical protein AABW51_03470 [Nanoarchaeota archaeon]
MTNITLSIDDEVYKKMKTYSEIKWSEFVRKMIKKRIDELEKLKNFDFDSTPFLGDEKLLAEDWLSEEDNKAWNNL